MSSESEQIIKAEAVRADIYVGENNQFAALVNGIAYPAEIGEGLYGTSKEYPDLLVTFGNGLIKVISEAQIG